MASLEQCLLVVYVEGLFVVDVLIIHMVSAIAAILENDSQFLNE